MHLSGREPPGRLPKRMRRRHRGDRSPSSGGNLPSDRHLTRRFYSCSKSQLRLYRSRREKAREIGKNAESFGEGKIGVAFPGIFDIITADDTNCTHYFS